MSVDIRFLLKCILAIDRDVRRLIPAVRHDSSSLQTLGQINTSLMEMVDELERSHA